MSNKELAISLQDGSRLIPLLPEDKKKLEDEMTELLAKYEAIIVPIIETNVFGALTPNVNLFKKVIPSPLNVTEETNTETAKSSEGNSEEPA